MEMTVGPLGRSTACHHEQHRQCLTMASSLMHTFRLSPRTRTTFPARFWETHHNQWPRCYHEVSFAHHGEPSDVLHYRADANLTDEDPSLLQEHEEQKLVRVQILHAPWNPADVNTVQGRYPLDKGQWSKLSRSRYFDGDMVIGSEGLGKIENKTKDGATTSDLVTVGWPGLGTLRSSLWVPKSTLLRVPNALYDKTGPAGCALFQLGGTALRMLSDFVTLEPGEVVVQNAGNSGVGLFASQLARSSKACGLDNPMVSLVREGDRSDREMQELVDYLTSVGKNALVVTEERLADKDAVKDFQSELRDLSPTDTLPRLALNAVGGSSAKLLLKVLGTGGTMVTYGGMSGKGVEVGTPQLIFKDVRVMGYWHSHWMMAHSQEDKQYMVDALVKAVLEDGVECPPVQTFPLHNLQAGLHWQSRQSAIRKKLVWDCQE